MSSRARALRLLAALLLPWLVLDAGAAAQEKVPQSVYTGSVFDGTQYVSIFSPAQRDTLYLLANTENALALRSTLVYFWETTGEYVADWESRNELLEGDLEIYRGDRCVLRVGLVPKVLVRQRNETRVSEILFGDEATRRYQDHLDDIRRYQAEYERHSAAVQQYQEELWARFQQPEKYENTRPLIEPKPPDPVHEYVTEPAPAYRVSLPAGNYHLQIVDGQGTVVPGSEKRLRVFSHRRQGIGYVAYTDHRWTNHKVSREPDDVIYVGQAGALFLRTFAQVEYYADDYWNLTQPQKVHDKLDSWIWVDVGPHNTGRLRVVRPGGSLVEVERRPFYVEQVPGKTRGYRIVDVDRGGAETWTTFEAFKIDLDAGAPGSIRLIEGEEEVLGSRREIRAIVPSSPWLVPVPALAILVVGAALITLRRLRTRR